MTRRRQFLPGGAVQALAADELEGDPFRSGAWTAMHRRSLSAARPVCDGRVQMQGPGVAADPTNVPISVRFDPVPGAVERISILVDRRPIRRRLDFEPLAALPALAFAQADSATHDGRLPARALAPGVWVVEGPRAAATARHAAWASGSATRAARA